MKKKKLFAFLTRPTVLDGRRGGYDSYAIMSEKTKMCVELGRNTPKMCGKLGNLRRNTPILLLYIQGEARR
jgi:hypothetical protein